MPIYLFSNEKGEIKEVYQKMNEPHVYFENGVEWKRVYTVPNMGVDVNPNPMSSETFIRESANKKGTIGDLVDKSKELSDARKKIYGRDPIQDKFFDNYKKRRNGKAHPLDDRPAKPKNNDKK